MINIINAELNEQCYFDFEMQGYGLRDKSGELLKVYYSGLYMGLPFVYESKESAEEKRKKYASADKYTVESLTDVELMDFMNKLNQRLEDLHKSFF